MENVFIEKQDMQKLCDLLKEKLNINNSISLYDIPSAIKDISFYNNSNYSNLNYLDLYLEGKISEYTFGLKYIPSNAFSYNVFMQSITFPRCVSVYENAFDQCISLEYVGLSNVLALGNRAFAGCGNLSTIDISNCTSIGINAFAFCSNLETVNLNSISSVTILSCAFYCCSKLKNINLQNAKINYYAFYQCRSLESITINLSQPLSNCAFSGCTNLQTALLHCNSLGSYAFNGCTSLSVVSYYGSIIGSSCFLNCTSLSKLYLYSRSCNLVNSNAFAGTGITSRTGTIYVLSSYYSTYFNSSKWSYFKYQFVSFTSS